jgi:predicted  nucleic acid-binding Zn-ribbon protein
MNKTCLKCNHTAEVDDNPLAECPKCGAIYSRVEALEQRKVEERQQQEAKEAREAAARALAEDKRRRAVEEHRQRKAQAQQETSKRWFTPRFAKVLFALWAFFLIVPAGIGAAMTGTTAGMIGFAIAVVLGIAGLVILESILVVFHIAETLDDCKRSLRKIAGD